MKFFKLPVIVFILLLICTCASADTVSYEIPEYSLENIKMPDGYIVCTKDSCDDGFKKLLSQNGFSFETWKAQVMEPNNYFLYACLEKDPTKCIYVICENGEIQETTTQKDGTKLHRHMNDYNLIPDGEEKDKFLKNLLESVVLQGVNSDNIIYSGWLTENVQTPYTELLYKAGNDYMHFFETIYNGNDIWFLASAKKPFTENDIEALRKLVKDTAYSETPDYTEVKEIINENLQQKLAEETHSGENTRVVRYIISACIAMVIVFSVYMALRTQSKKRKKITVISSEEDNK